MPLQCVELAAQLDLGRAVVFDRQNRLRVALDEADLAGVAGLLARQLDQHAVHQLDGGGLRLQDRRSHRHRFDQVVELQERQRRHAGRRHQPDGDIQRGRQRALRRDDQPGGIKVVGQELVERVASRAQPVAREVTLDEWRVPLLEVEQLGHQPAERVSLPGALDGRRVERHARAVGQQQRHLAHVVGGHAVQDRVRAGRVVGHHAAQRGAVAGAGIGSEHQAVRLELRVEQIEVDAGLHARPALLRVDLQHLIHVLGEVDDERRADRLARQRRAAAARQHADAVPGGQFDGGRDIVGMPRNNDADWLDLVVAGVGRIQHAAGAIEAHLAIHTAA